MTDPLPSWPDPPPRHGRVLLRAFADRDVPMARELATDPYVPLVGTLPAGASEIEALDWVNRQLRRHPDGIGFSFAIADAVSDLAVGAAGLWCRELAAGRAAAGYSIAESARGQGLAADALMALTGFGWTIPQLHRIELHIEEWNTRSIRTAKRAGFLREGLLRSHQEIGGRRRDMLLYARVRPPAG